MSTFAVRLSDHLRQFRANLELSPGWSVILLHNLSSHFRIAARRQGHHRYESLSKNPYTDSFRRHGATHPGRTHPSRRKRRPPGNADLPPRTSDMAVRCERQSPPPPHDGWPVLANGTRLFAARPVRSRNHRSTRATAAKQRRTSPPGRRASRHFAQCRTGVKFDCGASQSPATRQPCGYSGSSGLP